MDFSVKVVKQALVEELQGSQRNVVSSPLSITALLSMLAMGVKGRVLEQLLGFLGCESVADIKTSYSNLTAIAANGASVEEVADGGDKGPLINFVNGVWVDQIYTLKPSFEQVLTSVFGAETKSLDFANKADEAAKEINSWVNKATNGLIERMVDVINKETMLILANALYFKGFWECAFDENMTKDRSFYLLNGEKVEAPFMRGKWHEHQLYRSFETFKVVKLPYKNSPNDDRQFSIHLFLPNQRKGLHKMLQEFSDDPMLFLNQNLELHKTKLEQFLIPKFKFSYAFDVSKIVHGLGLELNFGELTEMIEHGNGNGNGGGAFGDTRIFQRCQIVVNEVGTEAAALTCMVIPLCFENNPSFVADHPFMFMIKEDTSATPFFIGVLLNPLE